MDSGWPSTQVENILPFAATTTDLTVVESREMHGLALPVLVERCCQDVEAGGSAPLTPTTIAKYTLGAKQLSFRHVFSVHD